MRRKHRLEDKLQIVKEIANGKSIKAICRDYQLDRHTVYEWYLRYEAYGRAGLQRADARCRFTKEEKESIVQESFMEGVTLLEVCILHNISRSTLKFWRSKYAN